MRDDFKSYDLIAIHAGRKAGLKLPTVAEAAAFSEDDRQKLLARVADSKKAVKLRDRLFVDFERRLRDPGYDGGQIRQWFAKTYGPIGRASIFRVRAKLRASESKIAEIAAQAQAYVELAAESGGDSVFRAASKRAGQLIFQLLMEVNADALGGKMDLSKMIGIVTSLAKLQKSRAETELLTEKLADLRRTFDREIAAAQAKTKRKDGRLTPQMIQQVREAVFGSAA